MGYYSVETEHPQILGERRMIEAFLSKIVGALLAKAVAKLGFIKIGKAIQIYSGFDTIVDSVHCIGAR
jgi:hypothetical protein